MDTSPISSLSEDVADKQQPDSVFRPAAFPALPRPRRPLWPLPFPSLRLSANKVFANKILGVINPDDDLVWVHHFLPTCAMLKRINEEFGNQRYEPVVLIVPLQFYENIAYFVVVEYSLVSMVRDEMNLILRQRNEKLDGVLWMSSRQGNEKLDGTLGTPMKSILMVAEFIGCSPSLNNTSRVDPWNVDAVSDVMDSMLDMAEPEKQLQLDKHYSVSYGESVHAFGIKFRYLGKISVVSMLVSMYAKFREMDVTNHLLEPVYPKGLPLWNFIIPCCLFEWDVVYMFLYISPYAAYQCDV